MDNINDIRNLFKQKYENNEFRILKDGTKTIEIQNAHFVCDQDFIIREPNYDYAKREVEWYDSKSLNVNDIPGNVPTIWKSCADKDGFINSNYGWCIYSEENGNQYENCLNNILNDINTRQAVMIYTRPNIHTDAHKNGRYDFICTFAVQCFMNKIEDRKYRLKYIVYMRSNDAVFGFNSDLYWHKTVQQRLARDIENKLNIHVSLDPIEWNAATLHVYERHFKFIN